ncbi:MAG: Xaa-Pro peptidase family protein [Deltaproteobacteria bacterium]|jgi:Xaa-Pro aminopeptidase|nr:Xaa-Pro peptidase family protein [Deltaproteobacteria bacterium]
MYRDSHENHAKGPAVPVGRYSGPPPKPATKPRNKHRLFPDQIPKRLKALRERMDQAGVNAVLVQSPENRRYLSGFLAPDTMFTESSGSLVVTLDGDNFLLTDSRYTEAAKKEAPHFEVLTYRQGLAQEFRKDRIFAGDLFFEGNWVTVDERNALEEALGEGTLKPLPFRLGDLRVIKSDEELRYIKRATEITEISLGLLWPQLEPGVSENWAKLFLEDKFRTFGGEGPAFPSIVAAGVNAALPHAEPSNKKFGKTEMVVIDLGARYKGYASDMTRTFMPYKPQDWQKEIYLVVRQAQELALAALGPGKTGQEVDKVARDFIASKGYAENFNHSLGHGVGLLVHEEPRLSPNATQQLQEGMVVTVEPGIYIPGKGGVRLEQLVAITGNGCRVLNKDKHFYKF